MFKETGHHHLILVRCYFAGKGEWLMKKFNLIISLWLAGVIIFCSASAAPGQVQGKIKGKVIDAQGNPLEKAEVTIVSVVTASKKYETTTGKDGRFSQVGLQPGYYQVIVKKEGFVPRTQEFHVGIASETELEVTLVTADQAAVRSLSEADKSFVKATKLYNEQKYEEALSVFEEAIGLNPDNWAYYFNIGLTYKKLNRLPEAKKAFEKAANLNPQSFSSNKELGELLAKEGDFERAADYYRKAVEINPDDPDGHYNLGVCLANLGKGEEALVQFQKTIELKPDYSEAYFQLGSLYISQNKTQEAISSLEKFLQLAPQSDKAPLARQLLDFLKK